MTAENSQAPPSDFPERLSRALWKVRVGDYAEADALLSPLRPYLPTEPVALWGTPGPDEYYRLRLATLFAEVAEYKGDYYTAELALRPYRWIEEEVRLLPKDDVLDFYDSRDPRWVLFRQKLYYVWQVSVASYRVGNIARSRELLNLAIHLAERIRPRSEALLGQLYYGAGKLAFHEYREVDALRMYRTSLESTSRHLALARSKPGFREEEAEAARYSMAKTLTFGLAQCLREQGRLEEAHTQVVAGLSLLNLGRDQELSHHANLLLGSIERRLAGERKSELLEQAGNRIAACAEYFEYHKGEVGHRSRLELALVAMQQHRLAEARAMLERMLKTTADPKWVAECNLGLSRVARRTESYAEAIEFARESMKVAKGLERIRRRAHVAFVLALYAAATDGGVRDDQLRETLREIDRALLPTAEPNILTRANMLLTKARALNAKGEIATALAVYNEYEAIKPLVEVGRIHELAETVENELRPTTNSFRCPADFDPPIYDLDQNIEAVRRYVIQKVTRTFATKTEQANALKRNRTTLYTDVNRTKGRR